MPSWVQDPETGKLIPKGEYSRKSGDRVYIQGDIESFVSPITQEVISDRAQLREHNRRHGVTDSRDYSPEFMQKKTEQRINTMLGKTEQAKAERKDLIRKTLQRFGL